MIVHWLRERQRAGDARLLINTIGCAMTGVVAVVVLVAKAPNVAAGRRPHPGSCW
jgi:hypothetical protein